MVKGPSYRTIPLLLAFACALCSSKQTNATAFPNLDGLKSWGCAVTHVEGVYRLTGWAWHGNAEGEKQCGAGKDWCIELYRNPSVDRAVSYCLKWYHRIEKEVEKQAKAKK